MTTGCLYHPIARRGMNLCSPGNRGLFPACSRKALRQRFSNFLESPCSLPFWPSRSRQMELFNGEGCRQLLRSSWFSFACSFFWSLTFQANQILFPYFRLFTPAFTFVLVFICFLLFLVSHLSGQSDTVSLLPFVHAI